MALPSDTVTLSARLLLPFIAAIDALPTSVDQTATLARFGLAADLLHSPQTRVAHATVDQLLKAALAATGERDLGLIAAAYALPQHLDVLEYAARTQPTLGRGLEVAMAYHAVLHEGLEIELGLRQDQAVLRFSFGALSLPDASYEFAAAVYVLAMRRITARPELAPLEVRFRHPKPPSIRRHKQIFRCPIRFEADEVSVVCPRAYLELPTVAPDAGLAALLDQQAQRTLAQLQSSVSLAGRVRRILELELTQGQISAERLARRLAMSSRTLHRRLRGQGTSYRALADEVRRELAMRYLAETDISVREVGSRLGFTTGPAFHRAFRRWTGTTASGYRQRVRARSDRQGR